MDRQKKNNKNMNRTLNYFCHLLLDLTYFVLKIQRLNAFCSEDLTQSQKKERKKILVDLTSSQYNDFHLFNIWKAFWMEYLFPGYVSAPICFRGYYKIPIIFNGDGINNDLIKPVF